MCAPNVSATDKAMPAIVPPVDEIAIGHQFPGCKQDHQYTGRHAAYRSRYRLVADCPRCNQQSQTEEKLSPLLQIGRNGKSLHGKQNDQQPKYDGYPGSRPGEAQDERRAGPGCLNKISASISGASARVRLPSEPD